MLQYLKDYEIDTKDKRKESVTLCCIGHAVA